MTTSIIDFPRGGEQIKPPQRKRQRDQNESIFHSNSDKDYLVKKKKIIKPAQKKSSISTPVKPFIIEKRRIPDWVHHKNISEDTILLGVVKEIQEMVALLSLPYNLIGRIDITDVSAVLSQNILEHESDKSIHNLFYKGQFVVCRVKQVGKGTLGLTCDPVLVNKRVSTSAIHTGMTLSGVVTSKEDHGYQISFGIDGTVGFLLNKRAKAFIQTHNEGNPLCVGQVLLCHVESGGTRAVPVSIDPDKVNCATPPPIASFDNIVPFQSVECCVTHVLDGSLVLEVVGGYTASCAPPHLKKPSDGLEEYKKKTVIGRVIWVRQDEKQIGVSLKRSLIKCDQSPQDDYEIGDIFEDSEVIRSEMRGLFLKLRENLLGFCPLHNVSDDFLNRPGKSHRKGTTHKCRVISYNALDDMVIVSLRASVIEEKFLNFQFVKVGNVVTGKIVSRSEKGLLVNLSPHVKGFCPKGHFSDRKNQSKSKQKKLQEGCEDTFRVLKIEARQRVTLTHKKGLIRSTHPVLSEYSSAVIGQCYHGVVVGLREFGCVVKFFQEVRGILHKSKLQLMPSQPISDLLCEGQVVECCVVSCEPADQKLELSLPTDSVLTNVELLENFSMTSLTIGGISPNGLELYCSDTKEKASLPIYHLSDFRDIQQMKFKSLEKRLEINDQLILSDSYVYTQSGSGHACVLSLKESIGRDISGDVTIQDASEVETGVLIHGVVKRVEKYGFIVGYPGGCTGLLPNRYIRDEFVDSPAGILSVGDTVLTRVMEVTEGRFVLSSRDSDVISQEPPDGESITRVGEWFVSYLSTRDTLLREVSDVDITSCVTPGQIIGCSLKEMGRGGTTVSLSTGTTASVVGLEATELSVGETYSSCVLGISTCPTRVYVSLNESLVESYSTAGAPVSELTVGSSVQARVHLVLPQYMVGLVATLHGPRLVYIIREIALSTRSFQNFLEQYLEKRVNIVILNTSLYGDEANVVLGLLIEGSQLSSTQKKQLVRGREEVEIGSVVNAQVKEMHPLMLKVRVGAYSGRILATEILDNPEEGSLPTKQFHKGEILKAKVIGKSLKQTDNLLKREYTVLQLTLSPSKMIASVESIKEVQVCVVGEKYYGCVEEVWPHSNLVITTGVNRSIYIPLLMCSQDIDVLRDLEGHFKLGQAVKVELLQKQKKSRKPNGTLIQKVAIEVGSIVCAHVTQIYWNQALMVSLPFGETARIDVTDLVDSYSKEMTDVYTEKQLLQAKVVEVGDKIILTTRESCISEFLTTQPVVKDRVIPSIHDLTKGEILRGFIKSATDVGVFVKLSRTLTGRVRIKNMSDQFIREYKEKFPVGKVVKCKVLNIDSENGYVDLSLRLSHTNPEKFARLCAEKGKPDKNTEINEMKRMKLTNGGTRHNDSGDEDISDVTKVRNPLELRNQSSSDEDIEMTELEVDEIRSIPMGTQKITSVGRRKRKHTGSDPLPRLDGTGGFKWEWDKSENNDNTASSESDQTEEDVSERKKTKRQKRAVKRREEEEIYRAEQSLLDQSRQPESAQDFDRLLLANPNSSYLWIQYIAYQLHLADVEKAREIGKKALESINFRLEEEKLNVWISLLNLENMYGTPESLESLFQEGLRENETETLHFKLAHIYVNSNKLEEAEDIYKTMIRKFKSNPRVWKEYGQLLMNSGKMEQARELCENALLKLADKFHVEILAKFGQFEFRHGDAERGRTVFETLLSNHPKRLDIWFVYIDTLIKHDLPDSVREVCERGTALNLSVNKMKSFYKKYLSFEQTYGSDEDVNRVMENAREFVQSKLAHNSNSA